jgi:hypothetical protein
VPTSGPLAQEELLALVNELDRIDQRIAGLSGSQDVVSREISTIATELREDAVGDIDLLLRVAQRTSGPLDAGILRRAQQSASQADAVLTAPAPKGLYVMTDIGVPTAGANLYYVGMARYRKDDFQWESYTSPSRLRIGRYMFQVVPCGPGHGNYEEPVLVFEDPTRRTLQPRCEG